MNRLFDIRREEILRAIRDAGWFMDMGNDLPRGEGAGEGELRVQTGQWCSSWGPPPAHIPPSPIIQLTVRVLPSGVANRIQAKCPDCGTWMRFCGLKQHVGTATCRKLSGRSASKTEVFLEADILRVVPVESEQLTDG